MQDPEGRCGFGQGWRPQRWSTDGILGELRRQGQQDLSWVWNVRKRERSSRTAGHNHVGEGGLQAELRESLGIAFWTC